jgi:chemotaxis response regulator CheB
MDNKEELEEAHRQYMAKVEAYAEQKKKENSPEHEEFHKSEDSMEQNDGGIACIGATGDLN